MRARHLITPILALATGIIAVLADASDPASTAPARSWARGVDAWLRSAPPEWLVKEGEILSVRPGENAETALRAEAFRGEPVISAENLPDWISLSEDGTLRMAEAPKTDETKTIPFKAIVTDGRGRKTFRQFSVKLVNSAPTIAFSPPPGMRGAHWLAVPTVIDRDGDKTTLSVEGNLPKGISFDPKTGRISGIAEEPGVFPVVIVADDDKGGRTTAKAEIAISHDQPPRWMTAAGELAAIRPGQNFVGRISASDPEGNAIKITSDDLPDWLSLDPDGTMKGTVPKDAEKEQAFSAAATDGWNVAEKRRFILRVINSPPSPPELVPTPDRLFVGKPIEKATLRSSDPDGDPLALSLSGALPKGISFDAASATLSGSPEEAGTFSLTMAAADPWGAKTETTINLRIIALKPDALDSESLSLRLNDGTAAPLPEYGKTIRIGEAEWTRGRCVVGTRTFGPAVDEAGNDPENEGTPTNKQTLPGAGNAGIPSMAPQKTRPTPGGPERPRIGAEPMKNEWSLVSGGCSCPPGFHPGFPATGLDAACQADAPCPDAKNCPAGHVLCSSGDDAFSKENGSVVVGGDACWFKFDPGGTSAIEERCKSGSKTLTISQAARGWYRTESDRRCRTGRNAYTGEESSACSTIAAGFLTVTVHCD
jgi:hypothetical protein